MKILVELHIQHPREKYENTKILGSYGGLSIYVMNKGVYVVYVLCNIVAWICYDTGW